MAKKILEIVPMNEEQRERLSKAAPGCEIVYKKQDEVTEDDVRDAEIIIGNPDPAIMKAAEKLELLQLRSAGSDMYLKNNSVSEKTIITNVTGAYNKSVAEHMFAMLLMILKKLHLYRDNQNALVWRDEKSVTSPGDLTVLVIGLGDIGLYFARLCKALGSYVIGIKKHVKETPEGVDELYTLDALDSVLPRADVVILLLPSTKETIGLFDLKRMSLMKNTAIIMNAGRGDAIITKDLYTALTTGVIGSAGIDVMEVEPLPADDPLWKLPNAVITPHIAGHYHLAETVGKIVNIAIENVEAYLSGKPLRNVVDKKTGLRIESAE